MSQSFNCRCPERSKPLVERAWMVTMRNYRCSAFDGYQSRYSDYSEVRCGQCRATGRTKAAFVTALPNAPKDWARVDATFTREEISRPPQLQL